MLIFSDKDLSKMDVVYDDIKKLIDDLKEPLSLKVKLNYTFLQILIVQLFYLLLGQYW